MLSVQKKQYEKPLMVIKIKPNKISSDLFDHKKNRHLAHTLCTTALMCMMAMPTGAQEADDKITADSVEVIEVSGLFHRSQLRVKDFHAYSVDTRDTNVPYLKLIG